MDRVGRRCEVTAQGRARSSKSDEQLEHYHPHLLSLEKPLASSGKRQLDLHFLDTVLSSETKRWRVFLL